MGKYEIEIVRTREQYLKEVEEEKQKQKEMELKRTCPECGQNEYTMDNTYITLKYRVQNISIPSYISDYECGNVHCGCKWNVKKIECVDTIDEPIVDKPTIEICDKPSNLEPSTRGEIMFGNGSVIKSIKGAIKRSRIKQ